MGWAGIAGRRFAGSSGLALDRTRPDLRITRAGREVLASPEAWLRAFPARNLPLRLLSLGVAYRRQFLPHHHVAPSHFPANDPVEIRRRFAYVHLLSSPALHLRK